MKTFKTLQLCVAILLLDANWSTAEDKIPVVDQPPVTDAVELKIDGATDPYTIGDLIQLDASLTGIDESSTVAYDWKIQPIVSFKKWPDNSKIILGTGHKPEKFTVFLSVAVMTKVDQETKVVVKSLIQTIIVVPVDQNQTPIDKKPVDSILPIGLKPEDETSPATPVGEFGLAAIELSKQVKITEFYTKETYDSDVKKLADNFSLIANQLKEGKILSLEIALSKTREFNSSFQNRIIWTEWFNGLSNKLSEANDNGKLQTVEDISKVWSDISNGLKSI